MQLGQLPANLKLFQNKRLGERAGSALPEGHALTWLYRVTKVSASIVSSESSSTILSSRSSRRLGWNASSASRFVRKRGYEIVEAFETAENPNLLYTVFDDIHGEGWPEEVRAQTALQAEGT